MRSDSGSKSIEHWVSVLRTWASMGVKLSASRSREFPSWAPVARLIEAAQPVLEAEARTLRELLDKSRKVLKPLSDPFDLDLGLHRWLATDREEAYSDWLQWVVEQAATPARIYRLFNLGTPPSTLPEKAKVCRELCVPHGYSNQEGRLDLVIRFGNRAIIVVEIKKGAAKDSELGKHSGYIKWLDDQQDYPKENKHTILLATPAEEEESDEFVMLPWKSVCVHMRLLATELRHTNVAAAAMVLAFVAAVEQNLLGFSASVVRAVSRDATLPFNPRVVDHLADFLNMVES